MKCSIDTELKCLRLSDLVQFDPDLENDPETGQPYDEDGPDEPTAALDKRTGSSRDYTIRTRNGRFTMRSPTYPAGANGDILAELNNNAGYYGAEDPEDCEVSQKMLASPFLHVLSLDNMITGS